MKHSATAFLFALLAAGSLPAAEISPTNQVMEAIAKLKGATNYSWTGTMQMADNQFTIGPVKGQADQSGLAKISQDFNDNTTEVVLKGDKAATKGDDGWQLITAEGGFETFFAANLARNGPAAQEAALILKGVKNLKAGEDGVFSGDLTTDSAADLLSFGPRRAANAEGAAPAPKNATGSAKFWIKDGMLAKYESHLHGLVTFGDNENDFDVTRTVEIQNVGSTKMDIPDEAKKMLEPKAETKPQAK